MVLRIRISGQPEMDLHAVCLHPVRAVPFAHLVVQSDLPKRYSVTEYASSPLKERRHISLVIFEKETVMQDVHHPKRVITTKQIRIEIILIDMHLPRLCALARVGRKSPSRALLEVCHLFRRADLYLSVPVCFITDHMTGVRPAALRMHPFPIHAGMNPDSVTGFCQISCLLNPREGMCRRSIRPVLRRLRIYNPFPLTQCFLLPEIKF